MAPVSLFAVAPGPLFLNQPGGSHFTLYHDYGESRMCCAYSEMARKTAGFGNSLISGTAKIQYDFPSKPEATPHYATSWS